MDGRPFADRLRGYFRSDSRPQAGMTGEIVPVADSSRHGTRTRLRERTETRKPFPWPAWKRFPQANRSRGRLTSFPIPITAPGTNSVPGADSRQAASRETFLWTASHSSWPMGAPPPHRTPIRAARRDGQRIGMPHVGTGSAFRLSTVPVKAAHSRYNTFLRIG